MRKGQCTLRASRVQEHVVGLLERFLQLRDYSVRCTAATVWLVLCAAAAKLTSIFAICQRLAIDLTLIPYHGEPFAEAKEIYRGQAKSGTSHFHAYASAYVVCRGQRFTVALTPVEKGEKMQAVVKRLLALARQASVRPRL